MRTSDRIIRLRDGRALGYSEYGARDGRVVVYAHGGLACRLDVASGDAVAEQLGIRLLAVDRPGVGLSDSKPGRTVVDWADDIAQLRDRLGFGDFATMGWSMGGQYALALGYALAPQVSKVAVIAGGLPLTEPGRFAQMPPVDRLYIRLSLHAPWLARRCFGSMGAIARRAPALYGRLTVMQLPPADAVVIRDEGFDTFAQMTAEAMRLPEGHIEDYRAAMLPWGFAPEDLAVPVDVWGGADDRFLDPGWPAELARRLPEATLRTRRGGHFLAHLNWHEILDSVGR